MDINVEHFRKLLRAKERDLVSELAALKEEAKRPEGANVGDFSDLANVEEETAVSAEEATVLTETLDQVREALKRIDHGTYGKCVDCGRVIELARLEAIPWTEYCRQHQKNQEVHASAV